MLASRSPTHSLQDGSTESHASFSRLLKLAVPEIPLILIAIVGLLIGSASGLAMPSFFGKVMEALLNPDPGMLFSGWNLLRSCR